jgi:hypothetical protein
MKSKFVFQQSGRNRFLSSVFAASFLLVLVCSAKSFAWTEKALILNDTHAFRPNDLSLENAKLETNLKYEWVPGSLEWVRLDHEVTVPLARVKLYLLKDQNVRYRGRTYVSNHKTVELLVTLLQEADNKIELTDPAQSIPIRFQSTTNFQSRVVLDATCTNFAVSLAKVDMPNAWAIVFCRANHPVSLLGNSFQLELKVLWQAEGASPLNKANALPGDSILSDLVLTTQNSEEKIAHGKDSFTLKTQVPERFHPLAVGAGLGPYLHNDVLRPLLSFYAGFTLNEQNRIASFSAVPIGDSPHLDQGFYFITEQARALDDRASFFLLLGAHFVQFDTGGKSYFAFSAPQGAEVQFREFLGKQNTVTFGAFYYPEINGTSYINSWARFGWGSGFVELNAIRWKEAIDSGSYSAKSFGLSYGVPLFKAF